MTDAAHAIDIFQRAASLNRDNPLLSGSLLGFPNYGQVVMTGDIHGNRRNFNKLRKFCDLTHYGARHVILHEIIHEEVETLDGLDTSHELLLEAAEWKCEFSDQIHFLLSNHELAQVNRHEITKNGRVVTRVFEQSVEAAYGKEGPAVLDAMCAFMQSFALAGRTANRVFLSHSLPNPRDLPAFDVGVLERVPTARDLHASGPAHAIVWGRYHTESALKTLCELLDVDFFICGHQPQEDGYEIVHDRMVILASEHNHGVFLTLDLSKPVTIESLSRNIRPFAGVA